MYLPIRVICCQQFVELFTFYTTLLSFLSKYVFIECVIKLFVPVNFDYELTSANFIVFSTPLVAKKFVHNTVLINQFRSLKFLCEFGNAIYLVKYHRSDISIELHKKYIQIWVYIFI